MAKIHIQILIVSITTFIIYGFIDSLIFGVFLNEGLAAFFNKIGLRPDNSDVMVGALSSSVAIVISTYIKNYNKKIFGKLLEHPALDIIGVILGTYLYVIIVREYRKVKHYEY
jgi:uncharacterized membrane protein